MGVCGECKLICREAKKRLWVYLIVVFLSGFSSFLTWLALDSAGFPVRLLGGGVEVSFWAPQSFYCFTTSL